VEERKWNQSPTPSKERKWKSNEPNRRTTKADALDVMITSLAELLEDKGVITQEEWE
jgi:hypothetical protein